MAIEFPVSLQLVQILWATAITKYKDPELLNAFVPRLKDPGVHLPFRLSAQGRVLYNRVCRGLLGKEDSVCKDFFLLLSS